MYDAGRIVDTSYSVFYFIEDDVSTVTVTRIFYDRRDIERLIQASVLAVLLRQRWHIRAGLVCAVVVPPGTVCVTIVASEAVFAACPVSGAVVSVRFFVRSGLVIGFDGHKIRLDREVIKGDVVHADVSN